MPKRVIDFDAMWGSDKLASCAPWAQAEYAWLYGLADASGCFEITNLRVIWGRVAAIRANLTIERLEQIFLEFQDKGLLFVWEHEGKRYAHWTGSDVPGRLPPPSWRMRLERFAPPVPKQRLAEYMARFARGRAALAGVGFRGEDTPQEFARGENLRRSAAVDANANAASSARPRQHEASLPSVCPTGGATDRLSGLNPLLEGTQTQGLDLGSDLNLGSKWEGNREADSPRRASANLQFQTTTGVQSTELRPLSELDVRRMSAKELAVACELRVGQGPVCGPRGVKPEVLERERLRELERARARARAQAR